MLSKLINVLSKDKIFLDSMLANQLGIGEGMVRQLLHELVRQGYLENIVPSLTFSHCTDCASRYNSAKTADNRSAVWMLTEKGRQAAAGVYNKGDQ